MGRLDLILVLNFGGLTLLGQYVVMLTLAETMRTANRLLIETLLPSLTNSFAENKRAAAAQLFSINLRLLLAVDLFAVGILFVFIDAILALLGPQYAPLRSLFLLMLLFCGLSAPAGIGGTLLSSIGKQQRSAWVCMGQLAALILLFLTLWPRYHLAGAVIATGGSQLLSAVLLLLVAKASASDVVVSPTDYLKFLAIGFVAGLTAMTSQSPALALALWATALGVFLWLANYTWAECNGLVSCFLPGRESSLPAKNDNRERIALAYILPRSHGATLLPQTTTSPQLALSKVKELPARRRRYTQMLRCPSQIAVKGGMGDGKYQKSAREIIFASSANIHSWLVVLLWFFFFFFFFSLTRRVICSVCPPFR